MCSEFHPQAAYIGGREVAYSTCRCAAFIRYNGKISTVEDFINETKKEKAQRPVENLF